MRKWNGLAYKRACNFCKKCQEEKSEIFRVKGTNNFRLIFTERLLKARPSKSAEHFHTNPTV
jgi:hypothetical protein